MNSPMTATGTTADPASTILIVDDTPANLGLLVEHLEEQGYRIVVAQDGIEGIERAKYVQPELILLDVMMPSIDGFETCRRLKASEKTREIPVIFMTALDEPSHRLMGFSCGGIDYVTKPLQIAEVNARVAAHLALRTVQKQLAEQNAQLQQEITVRRWAENALQRANEELEERVKQRTQALARTNRQLEARIEEAKETEEALREREARIRRLMEANVIGVVFWDINGAILDANDAFLRMVGHTREDLYEGRIQWNGMTPDEYRDADLEAIEQVRRTGSYASYEKEFIRKDGRRIPVLIGGAAFEGSSDQGVAFVLDLTERRRAAAE